jgi:simple sugar transport system permease protein
MAETTVEPRTGGPVGDGRGAGGGGALARLRAVARMRELSILVVTIAVAIYFSVTTTAFNSIDNYHTVVQFFAPWAIVGVGEVMLLICGEIDLSAGFVFTLSPFVLMVFYNNGVPLLLSIIFSVLICAFIGAVNGFIRTRFNLPSFIVTLGMSFLIEGISLLVSNGSPVSAPSTGVIVSIFGKAHWAELIWVLVIVIVMQSVLSTTRFGIYTQAAGSNPVGAAESGIRTNRVKIVNFAVCSTLAGIGGIVDGMRVGSFDPTNGGANTMFLAVASAVIGGTALLGGSGTVVGALIGAALLGIVYDGFNLAGISANAFDVVLGVAILVAMLLNVYLAILRRRADK